MEPGDEVEKKNRRVQRHGKGEVEGGDYVHGESSCRSHVDLVL